MNHSITRSLVALLSLLLAACASELSTHDPSDAADAVGQADTADDAARASDAPTDAASQLDGVATPAPDAATCATGTVCQGVCIDTQSDLHHCGACDTDCTTLFGVRPDAMRCVRGLCEATNACLSGHAHCTTGVNTGCETDITTIDHCGSCAMRCGPGTPVCARAPAGWECGTGCSPSAPTLCGTTCVDLQGDPAHCGSCGLSCAVGPNAVGTCRAGVCERTCAAGFANCDGDWENGCEVAVATDTANCGACGAVCTTAANASTRCVAGGCVQTCAAGFSDCDGVAGNGCEVMTANDLAHCGACGVRCVAPANGVPMCAAGACAFACADPFVRCGSQCVRRDDPAYGCGSCTACAVPANAQSVACFTSGCGVSSCDVGFKVCGATCGSIFDPAVGCIASSCAPCPTAPHAASMLCSRTGLCQAGSCAAGYKLCGGSCVAITPANGCAAASCSTACAVQNAVAMCSVTGTCDYASCTPGWFDLDGSRTNGCETAGPATIPGLRVWLDGSNRATLHDTPCSRGNCVMRWDNLADPANPAVSTDPNTFPLDVSGIVRLGGVYFDGSFTPTAGGTFVSYPARDSHDQLPINLSFLVGSAYTTYVVATPMADDTLENYFVGCQAANVFDTNGAFHLGYANRTTLRLGHYNHDIDQASGGPSRVFDRVMVRGGFDFAHQYLASEWESSGWWLPTMNTSTGALTHATSCALGRGPGDGPRFRGFMHEIVMYNRALTAAESFTVERYLRVHSLQLPPVP